MANPVTHEDIHTTRDVTRVIIEKLGTSSKNNLRGVTLETRPIWENNSHTLSSLFLEQTIALLIRDFARLHSSTSLFWGRRKPVSTNKLRSPASAVC